MQTHRLEGRSGLYLFFHTKRYTSPQLAMLSKARGCPDTYFSCPIHSDSKATGGKGEFWVELDTSPQLLCFQKKKIKQGGSRSLAITGSSWFSQPPSIRTFSSFRRTVHLPVSHSAGARETALLCPQGQPSHGIPTAVPEPGSVNRAALFQSQHFLPDIVVPFHKVGRKNNDNQQESKNR